MTALVDEMADEINNPKDGFNSYTIVLTNNGEEVERYDLVARDELHAMSLYVLSATLGAAEYYGSLLADDVAYLLKKEIFEAQYQVIKN